MKEIFLINRHFTDLNPLNIGWQQCGGGHRFGPYARGYYLIHYVVSGSGTFSAQGRVFHVNAGEIFLIRPHEITLYQADEVTPWHYIWIGFNGRLARALDTLPCPVLPYRADTFFKLMEYEKSPMREELAASKLFEILATLLEGDEEKPQYAKLARDYINVNYMRQIKIADIARQLGINRQYLSRLFKSAYGQSMQEYLVQTRLHHAASLLASGSRVSEAAYMVGYEDAFNFSKAFKKYYGDSPQAHRKK